MARSSPIVRTVAQGVSSILVFLAYFGPLALLLLALHHAFRRPQLVVAAVFTFLVMAWMSRDIVGRLRRRRSLREHGVSADATIVDRHEKYAAIPSGYNGWTTTVTVDFTDASGMPVRAKSSFYYTRASAFAEGARLRVRYDPLRPTQIIVGDDDSRGTEVYLFMLPSLVVSFAIAIYFVYQAIS